MGSWRDKKVWAFTAVISRAWLTTVLWLWQASTLLPPAETASWPDYSTLATQRSIILGEKQRDVSQQQAETTKENWNKKNELHLLWCPATAEPHETQGSSCGPSCWITAGVQKSRNRQPNMGSLVRNDVQEEWWQPRFTSPRQQSQLCVMTVDQERQSEGWSEGTDTNRSSETTAARARPGYPVSQEGTSIKHAAILWCV